MNGYFIISLRYICVLFEAWKPPWELIAWKRAKISSFWLYGRIKVIQVWNDSFHFWVICHFKDGGHIACSVHRLQFGRLEVFRFPWKDPDVLLRLAEQTWAMAEALPTTETQSVLTTLPWYMIRESAAKGIPVCARVCVCLFFNVGWNVSGWQTVTCHSVILCSEMWWARAVRGCAALRATMRSISVWWEGMLYVWRAAQTIGPPPSPLKTTRPRMRSLL